MRFGNELVRKEKICLMVIGLLQKRKKPHT